MLMTITVMNPSRPRFKIRKHKMDNQQILFGNLWIAALGDSKVFVPKVFEVVITTSVISNNQCAWHNRFLNEAAKRLRASVRRNGEPDTSGVPSAPALLMVFAPGLLCRTSSVPVTRTLSWTPRPLPHVRPSTAGCPSDVRKSVEESPDSSPADGQGCNPE